MALRYRIPLLGLLYYSGRVGPRRWLPRSSNTGTGPMGFVVKWFVVYPSVAIFGAGLAILLVRISTCELGCPLVSPVGLASCPPSRDRTGRGTRPYAAHHSMFWG